MNEQVNEAMNAQMQNWVAGQIRSAILLGLSLYAKQGAAHKAGVVVGGNGYAAVALECAAYAEAAIWRLKSVQERGGCPKLVVAIEGFIAAETAAGRVAVIGYWNAENKWVSRTAAQFITDLKSAYAQRATIRGGR